MSLPEPVTSDSAWAPPQWGPRWSRWVGFFLCKSMWKMEIHGLENVPATGRIIVAANHTGLIDGPAMLGFTPRPAHFLVKGAFFKGPLGVLMRLCGQIPVLPGKGRDSLSAGRQVLLREDAVGIFPEGRRGTGDVSRLHPGVGWLSLHTETSVVPAAIVGSRSTGSSVHSLPKFRSRVIIVFGQAIEPSVRMPESDLTREHINEMTTRVQAGLQHLLQDTQKTYNIALPTDEGTKNSHASKV